MNQFYADPKQVTETHVTLSGQEAKHASKVLRKGVGETIYITNGAGTRYKCLIENVAKNELRAVIKETHHFKRPHPVTELCLGLIRKRDRLEFAVEKATELGVSRISLFRADHTEPFNVRLDRVEAAVLSAMKQSLREYLPEVKIYDSLDELLERDLSQTLVLQADADGKKAEDLSPENADNLLMIVGPEGGLSKRETDLLSSKNTRKVSLVVYRLRAETAAMVMSAAFGNKKADPNGPA
jgi:16S rRNA (uracil1498-N3)-methyltransferase